MPCSPKSSASRRTVVSSGSMAVARARSSRPVIREVVGDAQAQAAGGFVGAGGEFVVVADQGGGAGAGCREGGFGGGQGALDGDGGEGRTDRGALELADACGQFTRAYLEGPGRYVGGQVQEAAVAEGQQVVGDLADAVGDVQVDRGGAEAALGVAVEHHQGELVAADRGEGVGGHGGGDHAVQGGLGGGEGVAGGADALGGGVEDDAEAVFGGDAGGACVDAGEELRRQDRDDEQDGAGAAQAEVAGGEVGAVAQVACGLADAFGGRGRDPAAPLVAEHQGDRGLGDPGGLRHVAAGGAGAAWCHRRPAPW
jgi:hypothetical protein